MNISIELNIGAQDTCKNMCAEYDQQNFHKLC